MMGELGAGFGFGHGLFGGFWMILVWLLPVMLLVWGGKALFGNIGKGSGSALERLNQRYANGEIDRDEFLRRRDDLEKGAP